MKTFRLGLLSMVLALVLSDCKQSDLPPTPGSSIPTRDNNMALGNASDASTTDVNNYLLDKQTYTLSYNASRGIPNWPGRRCGKLASVNRLEGQRITA